MGHKHIAPQYNKSSKFEVMAGAKWYGTLSLPTLPYVLILTLKEWTYCQKTKLSLTVLWAATMLGLLLLELVSIWLSHSLISSSSIDRIAKES